MSTTPSAPSAEPYTFDDAARARVGAPSRAESMAAHTRNAHKRLVQMEADVAEDALALRHIYGGRSLRAERRYIRRCEGAAVSANLALLAGPRPRQRRPSGTRTRASRRGTSSSGSSSRGDPDEPPGHPSRPCGCGCGADLTGRRPQTLYATDACRKRAERAAMVPAGERLRTQLAGMEQSQALAAWRGLAAPERADLVDVLKMPRSEDVLLAIVAPMGVAS